MTEPQATPKKPSGLALALDFGPLLVFFLGFKFLGPITGTLAFMIAIIAAVIISIWKLKRVAPMLWLSAVLVVGFGAMTVYMGDKSYIQMKPTAVYLLLSGLLFGGLLMGKPLLKTVLEHGYDGLSERGWTLLSRNWAIFFLVLAIANEVMRRTMSFDTWLTVKVWGVTIVSFLFAMANLPMLTKHGLGEEQAPEC